MSSRFHIKIKNNLTGYTATQTGYAKNQQLDLAYNEEHTPAMLEPVSVSKLRNKHFFGLTSGSIHGGHESPERLSRQQVTSHLHTGIDKWPNVTLSKLSHHRSSHESSISSCRNDEAVADPPKFQMGSDSLTESIKEIMAQTKTSGTFLQARDRAAIVERVTLKNVK